MSKNIINKKNHIWVGSFSNKKEFDDYIDQEAYLKAWSIYDNEPPTGNPEQDKEPSEELKCQFCKDIQIDNYDEDFLITKYENRKSLSDFLSLIPANPNKLLKNVDINNLLNINSLVIIDTSSLDTDSTPSGTSKMIYLGKYEEDYNVKINDSHIQYSIWIGNTEKSEKEFTSYFSGGPKKSLFSKETNIKKYNPFSVKWHYFPNSILIENLVKQFIPNEISESVIKKTRQKIGDRANAIFFYVANEYKENEPTRIILKEFAEEYPIPPKFKVELDNYNDLQFVGSFKHES